MNKQLDFPLANKINEETGVIYFTNEMQNGIIHIDKIGLEDWIAFHEAAFEIIDGYYYNSGRKNEINNVIKSLYDLRLKLKNDKNPAQVDIKLLVDSVYGKTTTKQIETGT